MSNVIATLRKRDLRRDRSRCRICGAPHTVSVTIQFKHPNEGTASLSGTICDDCAVKVWDTNADLLRR